jgi:hypothetical protein
MEKILLSGIAHENGTKRAEMREKVILISWHWPGMDWHDRRGLQAVK